MSKTLDEGSYTQRKMACKGGDLYAALGKHRLKKKKILIIPAYNCYIDGK